jgi:hypothetical protein
MAKTVEDLRTIRVALVARRRTEAYRVAGEHHNDQLAKLNSVHTAIVALDAVIAEGEPDEPSIYETRGFTTL